MRYDAHDRDRARDLRGETNDVEGLLWDRIRAKRFKGWKFRRQHPLGPFVADFYCAAAKLVVELDGVTHRNRQEYDRMRDEWMTTRGIEVLRFENDAVHERIDEVLKAIDATCIKRIKRPSP